MAPTTPTNTSAKPKGRRCTPRKTSKFLDLSAKEAHDEYDEDEDAAHRNDEVPAKRPRKNQLIDPDTSDDDVAPEDMNVHQLKAALKEENKSTKGLKAELLARLLEGAENDDHGNDERPRKKQLIEGAAESEEESFAMDDFFAAPAENATGAAAVVPGAPISNLTMVGFEAKSDGQVICLDAAFAAEFKCRAGAEFASTKAAPGASFFSFTRNGDVQLARSTIVTKCANDAKAYMQQTIEPLLKTHKFQPVVVGAFVPVEYKITVSRHVGGPFAYTVTGDTAFVHFNDVYSFKIGKPCTHSLHRPHLHTHAAGKWSWNNAAKVWDMKRDIIASQCGYNGDERAPIKQLAQACKMNGFVKLELSKP